MPKVRVLAHSDSGARLLRELGARDVVRGDLADPGTLGRAFAGIERVFLLTHATRFPEQERNAVDAAAREGVSRVVKLSSEVVQIAEGAGAVQAGAPRDIVTALHQDSEQHIRETGLAYVFLRPSWFMNIHELSFVSPGIARGTVGWLGSASPLAIVDPDDVADVARLCLLSDEAPPPVLHLTGPQALEVSDIFDLYSKASGCLIDHISMDDSEYHEWLMTDGRSSERAQTIVDMLRPFAARATVAVTDDVEHILGRPARSYPEYLRAR
jgi:uncharacterized protein YbjT (DUF2867 family)